MKTSSWFRRYREALLGVMMLALGGFYLYHATFIRLRRNVDVVVSARMIPYMLGGLVVVLGLAQLIQGIRHLYEVGTVDKAENRAKVLVSEEEKRDILPIILTFILIFLYALSFDFLGFIVSSTLCMFFQMLILSPKGGRRPALFAIISVVVAFVVYIAFRRGLNLSLPRGILEGILPI